MSFFAKEYLLNYFNYLNQNQFLDFFIFQNYTLLVDLLRDFQNLKVKIRIKISINNSLYLKKIFNY